MKVHPLPISVSDLLDRRIVESERLELKAGWNPAAIMRSVCAFANDFQNLGGGYILIGTEAKDGLPVHPAFKAPVEVPVKVPVKVPVIEGSSLNNTERKILLLCKVRAVGRKEILAELGYSKLVGSVRLALGRLKELHLLELTIPDKPNSRNQQYRITDKGRQVLGVVK